MSEKCEGLPNGPCPGNKSGSSVRYGQGDLWLCRQCHNARFGGGNQINVNADDSQTDPKVIMRSDNASDVINTASNESLVEDHSPSQSPPIIQPVLAYIVFAMHSGTNDNVRNAVLGHFTMEQIIEAKDELWANGDSNVIGDKLRRKDSSVRSEKDAHVQDIINVLSKMDKVNKLPMIAVYAHDLHLIPRSHPEELNNVSLIDRLNRLEARITSLTEVVDRNMSENLVLKDKLESHTSYASVVRRQSGIAQTDHHVHQVTLSHTNTDGPPVFSTNPTMVVHQPPLCQQDSGTPSGEPVDSTTATDILHNNDNNVNNPEDVTSGLLPSSRGRGRPGRRLGRGRGTSFRGRGGRGGHAPPSLNATYNGSSTSLDRVSAKSAGQRSMRAGVRDDNDFQPPRWVDKKHKRQQEKRHRVVIGKNNSSAGTFK